MNLSETAYVLPSAGADFKVRFFTPRSEVDLCGHATVGTFAALRDEGKLDTTKSVYYMETKAGVLPVEISEVDGQAVFTLTQAHPALNLSLSAGNPSLPCWVYQKKICWKPRRSGFPPASGGWYSGSEA
jgi:PhzF family phenazine biosynthesis protein